MICYNCNTRNNAEDMVCFSCGKTLLTTPFTTNQRTWHIFNAIAPIVSLAFLYFFLQFFIGMSSRFSGDAAFGQIFNLTWIIIAIAGVMSTVSLYKNIMDLMGGVTQSHTARLMRKYRSGGGGGRRGQRRYYAEFEQIGKVTLQSTMYSQLEEGATYKVTFSPNTKRGWEFEQQ